MGALSWLRARALRDDGRPRPPGVALHLPEPLAPVQARPGPADHVGQGPGAGGAGARPVCARGPTATPAASAAGGGSGTGTGRARRRRPTSRRCRAAARRPARPRAPARRAHRPPARRPRRARPVARRPPAHRPRRPRARPATPRGTTSPPGSSTPAPAPSPTGSAGWPASSAPAPTGTRSCSPSSASSTCSPRPASGSPSCPAALADAVATSCGWQVRQADVLAGVPDTDTWVVAGRSDTREDRIEVRRTWLRGQASGRWAMVLSFAAYRQSLDTSLVVGDAFTADLHRYPGPSWRALIGARLERRRRPSRWRRRPPTSPARATRSARRSPPSRGSTASRRPSSPRRRSPAAAGCSPTTAARSPSRPTRRACRRCWPPRPGSPVTRHGRVDDRRLRPAHRPPARSGPRRRAACRPLVRERGMTASLDRALARARHASPCSAPTAATRRAAGRPARRRRRRHRRRRRRRRGCSSPVAGCVAARRAGVRPLAAGRAAAGARRRRPGRSCRPAAARRWWSLIATRGRCSRTSGWPSSSAAGGGCRPTSSSACCAGTAPTAPAGPSCAAGRGRSRPGCSSTSPPLRSSTTLRRPPAVGDPLPGLAVPPDCSALARGRPGRRRAGRRRRASATARSASPTAPCSSTSSPAPAPTPSLPLAGALAAAELPHTSAGARRLAGRARRAPAHHMLEELAT